MKIDRSPSVALVASIGGVGRGLRLLIAPLAALAVSVASCSSSSNPSYQDAHNQIIVAECMQWAACCSLDAAADTYCRTYGSTDTCKQQLGYNGPAPSGNDPCSQSQINQCASDYGSESCTDLFMNVQPNSCTKC